MKYSIITTEEALEEIIDYRGKTPEKSNGGIMTLSAKSVKNGYIDYSLCYYISEDEYKKFMVRGFPKVGDILLTTEAPLGMVARLDRDDVAIAQRLLTLRGKKGVLDNDYLLYYLQSPYGQYSLKSRQTGTTVTGIKQAEFRKIELKLPKYEYQLKVSSVLRNIDDIIYDNNRATLTLCETLQATCKQKFSLYEAKGKLSDICNYTKNRISVSNLTLDNYYSTENMLPNKLGAVKAAGLPTTTQTVCCKYGDVLISNIRPYFKKILYCYNEGGCSNDVLCFTPKKQEFSAYLFSTLFEDYFFNFMVAGSKGTKMPRGDKQQIMTYPIYLPTDEELKDFNELAIPILDQINAINIENAKLTELRDTLLPKLISGELDVSEVNI